jgi:putative redox protein
MEHKIITTWKGEMQFEAETPGGIVNMDSGNNGVSPKALMLDALAGCTGMDVVSLLKKMRAEVAEFKIEVIAELTEEHPIVYKKVLVQYIFTDEIFKKDKIEKSVNLSVSRYCGVYEMFRGFTDINFEIIYNEK